MSARQIAASGLATDADRVRAFYEAEVARHGYTYKGLSFNHPESQQLRFDVLTCVGDLHETRVLDVGAGLGDFIRYLWARDVVPEYTGLDLCDGFVAECRRRHTGGRGAALFLQGDILEADMERQFDYVIASGLFGLYTPGASARVGPTLTRMFALCRRAVAVNFLSSRAEHRAARRLYLDPVEVLAQAFALTPIVTLRHDYLPNDFTLYLYREPRWPTLDGDDGRDQ